MLITLLDLISTLLQLKLISNVQYILISFSVYSTAQLSSVPWVPRLQSQVITRIFDGIVGVVNLSHKRCGAVQCGRGGAQKQALCTKNH